MDSTMRRWRINPLMLVCIVVVLDCSPVVAGMPGISLTDLGRARLDGISFFLMGVLVSARIIQWIWNAMRSDWPTLPWLSYRRSLAMVSLIGMLMGVVLTMISGARELMTPGAWERNGLTYRLAADSDDSQDNVVRMQSREERQNRLMQVWDAIADYPAKHDGKFPSQQAYEQIVPTELRRLGTFPAVPLVYSPDLKISDEPCVIISEPDIYPDGGLAITTNGTVVSRDDGASIADTDDDE